MRMMDGELIGRLRFHSQQLPTNHIWTSHEEAEHRSTDRKPDARPQCAALHGSAQIACSAWEQPLTDLVISKGREAHRARAMREREWANGRALL
jgi:hypothetical protein